MKRKLALSVLITTVLIASQAMAAGEAAGGCCKKPADATEGTDSAQKLEPRELVSLDASLRPLVRESNAGTMGPQLVALLSPTCGGCVYAAEALLEKVVRENNDENVTMHIVWEPMLESDDLDSAERMAALFDDPRVRQYWDPDRASGIAYSREVFPDWLTEMAESLPANHDLSGYCSKISNSSAEKAPMWDFVAYYVPGTRWGDQAPRPVAFSKQALFYGKNDDLKSGTFWRDDFASPPLESDWYDEVRQQLARLVGPGDQAALRGQSK